MMRVVGVITALILGVGVVWQGVDIDAGAGQRGQSSASWVGR